MVSIDTYTSESNRQYFLKWFKKGQCYVIFCLRFFIKQLLLVHIDMPVNDFEFNRIFVELFMFVIDSAVYLSLLSMSIGARRSCLM
jgi:hypothetical protein